MAVDSLIEHSDHAITISRVSQNIRYCLWRAGIPHTQWQSELHARLRRLDYTPPTDLLTQGTSDPCVLAGLAQALRVNVQDLTTSDMLVRDRVDVFKENLKYLLGSQQRGAKKRLAVYMRIDQTTVSRWLSGTVRPTQAARPLFNIYFALDPSVDLLRDALFLSIDPPSLEQRKRWLCARIQELSPGHLGELSPALKRILGRPGT